MRGKKRPLTYISRLPSSLQPHLMTPRPFFSLTLTFLACGFALSAGATPYGDGDTDADQPVAALSAGSFAEDRAASLAVRQDAADALSAGLIDNGDTHRD